MLILEFNCAKDDIGIVPQARDYQYLVFPLSDDLFNNGLPASNLDEQLENAINTLIKRIGASGTSTRKLGFMVGFPGFDTVRYATFQPFIEAAVRAAIKTDAAIYFYVPSKSGWENRPDLWNYNDPGADGYNSDNSKNVEWSDWSGTAYPHEYRNWGTPEELPPCMCYNCPAIKSAFSTLFNRKIMHILSKAFKQLTDNNKIHLFAGVGVGDEQMLNNYEYVDTVDPVMGQFMTSRGATKVRIGFNALTQKGFSQANPPQDFAKALADVNQEFVAYLCKLLNDGGIPADKIYTHIAAGAGYEGTSFLKFSDAPLRVAFNNYSRPGFTTYITGNPDDLSLIYASLEMHGIIHWGATEANPYCISRIDPETYLNLHFNHGASLMVLNTGATDPTFANKLYDGVYGADAIKAYYRFLSNK